MKKFFYIISVIIISVSLAACGAKKPNNPTNNTASNVKITYTKELTYFPSYTAVNSETKPTQFTPSSKKNTFATARYTIPNTTDTKVFEDYENMLKKDGWTVTQDQKYFSIIAKKGNHMANILIQKAGKDIILVVVSK